MALVVESEGASVGEEADQIAMEAAEGARPAGADADGAGDPEAAAEPEAGDDAQADGADDS